MDIAENEHRNSEVKKDGGRVAWGGVGGGGSFFIAEFLYSISSMSIMTHLYMAGSSIGSHVQDIYMFNIYTCPTYIRVEHIYMFRIYIYIYFQAIYMFNIYRSSRYIHVEHVYMSKPEGKNKNF